MNKIIANIPNSITLLNLLSGMMAIVFAIDGQLGWAGLFICIASVFDFLDGMAAKILKAYSETGKQLDSLADIVSFGVAPAFILYSLLELTLFGKNQLIYQLDTKWYNWLILFSAFLLPVFASLRLARFNNDESGRNYFQGLPTPANALLWASFGLMLEFPKYVGFLKHLFTVWNLLVIFSATSILMVSTLPMFSLKLKSLDFYDNWYKYSFFLLSTILLLILNVYAIGLLVGIYIMLSVLFYLIGIRY
jgi:CDP-diacylglycerol---serine O-phosphatidyltransferase